MAERKRYLEGKLFRRTYEYLSVALNRWEDDVTVGESRAKERIYELCKEIVDNYIVSGELKLGEDE